MDMNLIDEVKKIGSKYNEVLEPPCTEANLKRLRERSRAQLMADVPDDYVDFLRITDGLDFNGMSVYASERTTSKDSSQAEIFGFVETNLIHRDVDVMRNYLVFGGDSLNIYVLDVRNNEYQVLDRVSLDKVTSFSSFGEMLEQAIKRHLLH